jgi:hypothetical protein
MGLPPRFMEKKFVEGKKGDDITQFDGILYPEGRSDRQKFPVPGYPEPIKKRKNFLYLEAGGSGPARTGLAQEREMVPVDGPALRITHSLQVSHTCHNTVQFHKWKLTCI